METGDEVFLCHVFHTIKNHKHTQILHRVVSKYKDWAYLVCPCSCVYGMDILIPSRRKTNSLCGPPLASAVSFSAGKKVSTVVQVKTQKFKSHSVPPPAHRIFLFTLGEPSCQCKTLAADTLLSTLERGRQIVEKDSQNPREPNTLSRGRRRMSLVKIQEHLQPNAKDGKHHRVQLVAIN